LNTPIYRFIDTVGDGSGDVSGVGDFSTTPRILFIAPPANQTFELHRMLVHIEDALSFDSGSYGNGITLTNGIKLKQTVNGVVTFLTGVLSVKRNPDWGMYCFDAGPPSTYGSGNEAMPVRWTFSKAGAPLSLNGRTGDKFEVILNDDFSGLVNHHFFVNGLIK